MAATLEDTAGTQTAVLADETAPEGAALPDAAAPAYGIDPQIAVCARSLWKVYGAHTALALAPENIEKDKGYPAGRAGRGGGPARRLFRGQPGRKLSW